MSNERYEELDTKMGLTEPLYFHSLTDGEEGFVLTLKGRTSEGLNELYAARFGVVYLYMCQDEISLLPVFEAQSESLTGGTFYRVHNSKLSNDFLARTSSFPQEVQIKHYAILTPAACIDVLSDSEPNLTRL